MKKAKKGKVAKKVRNGLPKYLTKFAAALRSALDDHATGELVVSSVTVDNKKAVISTRATRTVEDKATFKKAPRDTGKAKYLRQFQNSVNALLSEGCVIHDLALEHDGYVIRFLRDGKKYRRLEGAFCAGKPKYPAKGTRFSD